MKPTRPLVVILLITAAHYFHHQLTALVVPLLPFMRDGFSLSYTQAGGLVSAFALSYGIGQLPAGWLADRIGPRFLLLAGISGVAVAGMLVGLSQTYPALILFLIVMGIMGGGYHPSATPIISLAVPPSQRGRAVGFHLVGGSASHLVAPLLGVAIAGWLGWRGAFLVIAAPIFILGIAVFIIFGRLTFAGTKPEAGLGGAGAGGAGAGAASGAGLMGDAVGTDAGDAGGDVSGPAGTGAHDLAAAGLAMRDPAVDPIRAAAPRVIALFLAMTSVIGAIIASVIAFVPLFLVDQIGVSETHAAFGLALFFSAGLWAAPLGGMTADRVGTKRVFAGVAVTAGPLLIALAFSEGVLATMIVLLLLGAVIFVRMTVSESYLVDAVSPARRSTVLGVYFFAAMEGSGIITPILGNLIDRFGFRIAFGAAGGATMLLLVLLGIAMIWTKSGTFPRSRSAGILSNQ